MKLSHDWHQAVAADMHLPRQAAEQLRESGFVVIPGPNFDGGIERLAAAYDRAASMAAADDVHVGRTGASTRINDFVNRGAEFDPIYIHPPLLAACCEVIGGPFKLSGLRARTVHAGAQAERLHVDVQAHGNGWPMVGCILMVDAFTPRNGATRFVPGSHLTRGEGAQDEGHEVVAACGPAGSMIVFNASTLHGYGSNSSNRPRRSLQAHFIPRHAEASRADHTGRMCPETLQRIGTLAKYLLDLT